MRAGLLRWPITISAPGTTKDDFGQQVASASTVVLSTNASIIPISGKEVYALGSGFTAQVSDKVTIRFPEQMIRNNMTVVCEDGRQFLVQTARDPDGRRRELDIYCLELNP